MAFWEAAFGGSSGGNVRLRVQVDILGQEIGNNRTLIRYNAWIERVGSTSVYSGYTTYGNTNINGYNPGRSLGSYNFGTTSRYNLAVNEDYWIGHDANGNANPYFGANFNLDNSPYITSAATGGNYALPTIPRYANITSWGLSGVTEKSINVDVNVDRTSDLIDYSLNGGGWTRGYTGQFTSRTFTIPSLYPATAYSVKIRVRAADSGLYTESGLKSATTTAVTITSLTVPSATDTTLQVLAATSHVADMLQYRVQGASTWTDSAIADFTSKQVTVSGLTSNQTYTIEARARHKDSGQYTPIKTVTATTVFPQPLQPSGLSPTGGEGVSSLTPTLRWNYNATSTDTQSAYQVIVRRASDAVVMWDSGKITGGITNATVPASANLAYNVQYQWQVRTWSGTDITGPYSAQSLFKTSQPPVITVTSPTASQNLAVSAVPVSWTYSDPESTAQQGYRIVVETAAGEQVYDESFTGSATTFTMPSGILQNGASYTVRVYGKDTDGVWGSSSAVSFSITYIGPPKPSLAIEASEDKLFNRISVVSATPALNSYDTSDIYVFKRIVGETDWTLLDKVSDTSVMFEGFDAVTGWTVGGSASGVLSSTNSRYGNAVTFVTSGTGSGTYTKTDTAVSSPTADKTRVWVYVNDKTKLSSVVLRMGSDASNYYDLSITPSTLTDDAWNMVEVRLSSQTKTGNPNLSALTYRQVQVVATSTLATGDLVIDSWQLHTDTPTTLVYDYELANKTSYEYSAIAYSYNGLPSPREVYASAISITYSPFLNTYIIPAYAQSEAVATFMDTSDLPSWATKTDTEYHLPVGARLPVVYTSGTQKYKTGGMVVRFYEECFDGEGIDGVKKLEAIMNDKPLMVRTYWGEIYYISIDGQLNVTRIKDVGWSVSFNFTEIEA